MRDLTLSINDLRIQFIELAGAVGDMAAALAVILSSPALQAIETRVTDLMMEMAQRLPDGPLSL